MTVNFNEDNYKYGCILEEQIKEHQELEKKAIKVYRYLVDNVYKSMTSFVNKENSEEFLTLKTRYIKNISELEIDYMNKGRECLIYKMSDEEYIVTILLTKKELHNIKDQVNRDWPEDEF